MWEYGAHMDLGFFLMFVSLRMTSPFYIRNLVPSSDQVLDFSTWVCDRESRVLGTPYLSHLPISDKTTFPPPEHPVANSVADSPGGFHTNPGQRVG